MPKISKRIIKEGDTVAFQINGKNIPIEKVEEYVKHGKIENAEIVEGYIRVKENLPVEFLGPNIRLQIEKKLEHEGKFVGYKAKDQKGKEYKLTIEKIWVLAVSGKVEGIKAGVLKSGEKVILSGETDLGSLEAVNLVG